jgi:hypothetical protein|nr:MAG TPA: hypothetical protein [Caudoviricetes sp.]
MKKGTSSNGEIMKIENEFYVLIKLGTRDKNTFRSKVGIGDIDTDTVFLGKDDEFVDDIRSAIRAVNKKTAMMLIQEYESKHNYEKSGFVPILVTEKIIW